MMSFEKPGKRSVLTAGVVFFALAGSGTAFALSGGSSLVSTRDDGAATGRSAQALGTLSAAPAPAPGSGVENQVLSGREGSAPKNAAATAPAPGSNAVVPASSNSTNGLPFTGLLAIPVLLIGVGLLLGGIVARRRLPAGPASA